MNSGVGIDVLFSNNIHASVVLLLQYVFKITLQSFPWQRLRIMLEYQKSNTLVAALCYKAQHATSFEYDGEEGIGQKYK